MDINFELYKVFYHVAKNTNFSNAAEKLYISQSAVSQSIKLLEKKINCKLFFRNTKVVTLTKEGKILFKHVEQAFNLLKSGERAIHEMHSLSQGEIKIGASDTICKYYLMPYFKSFNTMYPNIRISVVNRTSPMCIELLKNGSVDFSIINMPDNRSYNYLNMERLKEVRDVFIANNNYLELRNKLVTLKDLEGYPFLVLEKNTITREFFDALTQSQNADIKAEIELGSVDVLVDMAKIGLGIAFVPEICLSSISNNEVFVINLKEKIPERYMGIITQKNIPLSIAATKFVEMLKNNV